MVVYGDVAFLLNGIVDYLLLLGCGIVTESPLRRGRFALAAVLGGGYAVAVLLPGLVFLSSPLWRAACAGGMLLIAFGPGRRLLRQGVIFLLLSACFCGIVLVIVWAFDAPAALVDGVVYYPLTFPVLVLTGGCSFGLIRWGFGRLSHRGGDVVPVSICIHQNTLQCTALRDTGNTLRDPIFGFPVLILEWKTAKKLFPENIFYSEAQFADPAALLPRLHAAEPDLRFRLISYRSVGVKSGLLLAMRPDKLTVDGKDEPQMLVAFSPTPVSDGGGYEALIGGVA